MLTPLALTFPAVTYDEVYGDAVGTLEAGRAQSPNMTWIQVAVFFILISLFRTFLSLLWLSLYR